MSKSGKTACLILLAIVIALGVINDLIWLGIDARPPRWDEAYYLTMSLKYHEAIFSGGVGSFVRSVLTLYPMNPRASGLSRVFEVDFVNVALVAVSLYLLVRTEAFSRKVPSLALGVVTGLGLLCGTTYPIFVIGPLGISAYVAWRRGKLSDLTQEVERPQLWVNSGLALLGLVVVAAPWYIRNLVPVVRRSLGAAYTPTLSLR